MTSSASPDQLVCAGEFFTDLIFSELDRLPSLGQEVKTENFAVSVGGGAAITATAAALLGRPTELVTVWGSSALDREARRRSKRPASLAPVPSCDRAWRPGLPWRSRPGRIGAS